MSIFDSPRIFKLLLFVLKVSCLTETGDPFVLSRDLISET